MTDGTNALQSLYNEVTKPGVVNYTTPEKLYV
jgi:hypothetical protein